MNSAVFRYNNRSIGLQMKFILTENRDIDLLENNESVNLWYEVVTLFRLAVLKKWLFLLVMQASFYPLTKTSDSLKMCNSYLRPPDVTADLSNSETNFLFSSWFWLSLLRFMHQGSVFGFWLWLRSPSSQFSHLTRFSES